MLLEQAGICVLYNAAPYGKPNYHLEISQMYLYMSKYLKISQIGG